ncbi:MAG: adenine deaminase [Bacilli bacterium]|nr:adenine deaminase [Bacilli bacterium]
MLEKYIKAALKQEPCSLVLKNATYVNVFTHKLSKGDIAIKDDKIVGIGTYSGNVEIDCKNKVVIPGLIDGHVHIESSMLTPEGFASLVVPHGTTSVIADPHEITNVCGMDGFNYMVNASKNVPLDIYMQLPSCVPATPFETSGAVLDGATTKEEIKKEGAYGLGEFMNYPGVLTCVPDVLAKIEGALASNKMIDGHAPFVVGDELNAYLSTGISTDHESCSVEEMREKLDKGMYTHLRVGSYTKDLSLVKAIDEDNYRRVIMCTDDKHCADIYYQGHLDEALRKVVKEGLNPITAVTMATLNCAICYNLKYRGGIAPGYFADLVIIDNLNDFNVSTVIKDGKIVAKDGISLFDSTKRYLPKEVLNTVHVKDFTADDFKIKLKGSKANVMTTITGGVMTGLEVCDIKSKNGDVDIKGTDILKMIVVERHKMTGNIGKGLIKGYGFKGGAMGISVAHDSHNIILLGDDNESLLKATNALRDCGGGLVLVDKKEDKVYTLPLEIAGLISTKDPMYLVTESQKLFDKAYQMGVTKDKEAFFSLMFLSLAVIPHIRLTDKGLVDVFKFGFIALDA